MTEKPASLFFLHVNTLTLAKGNNPCGHSFKLKVQNLQIMPDASSSGPVIAPRDQHEVKKKTTILLSNIQCVHTLTLSFGL